MSGRMKLITLYVLLPLRMHWVFHSGVRKKPYICPCARRERERERENWRYTSSSASTLPLKYFHENQTNLHFMNSYHWCSLILVFNTCNDLWNQCNCQWWHRAKVQVYIDPKESWVVARMRLLCLCTQTLWHQFEKAKEKH